MPMVVSEQQNPHVEENTRFIGVTPDMKEFRNDSVATELRFEGGGGLTSIYASGDDLAYYIAVMTGVIAPHDIRGDDNQMHAFAKRVLQNVDWQGTLRVGSSPFRTRIIPPTEMTYICRFGGIESRDEAGLATTVTYKTSYGDQEEREVEAFYARFVIQTGEYTGWSLVSRVTATYHWAGKDLSVNPRATLHKFCEQMGLTPAIMNDLKFDGVNPMPTLEAIWLKLAPQTPVALATNENGYPDLSTLKKQRLDAAPNIYPYILDQGGGAVAVKQEDRSIIEKLDIVTGVGLGDKNVSILNSSGAFSDAGHWLIANVLKPLSTKIPGMLNKDGRGQWPPSAWTQDAQDLVNGMLEELIQDLDLAQVFIKDQEQLLAFLAQYQESQKSNDPTQAW